MPLELKIDRKKFFSEIEKIKSTGDIILNKEFDSYQKLISETKIWEEKNKKFIIKNVAHLPERLKDKLEYLRRDSFESNNRPFGVFDENEEQHIQNLKEAFSKKIISIQIVCDYIKTSDSLNDEDISKFDSIHDKIIYVLNKLYQLYNDNFYSISMLLELNHINCRSDEGNEIATDLIKKGYAIKEGGYPSNDLVKMSLKGATYIERINKKSNIKATKKKESDINVKIDIVLKKLEELGFGQEILFNEIEELRGLSKVLNEKSWSQLIKGKVVDLALSKVISKEVATYIYESLVENPFKLLK